MKNKYPRIDSVIKKTQNTSARCKCGEVGKFKTVIQVNYMRGDDDLIWSCDEHKNNLYFLSTK